MGGVTRYLLDTNTVSYLIRQHPAVVQRVIAIPMAHLGISVITEAELLFGLARRPTANRLHQAVREFLLRVDVLPWNSDISACYARIRADTERRGSSLGPLDLLIAAQAVSLGRVMVTSDAAFRQIADLPLEDWAVT